MSKIAIVGPAHPYRGGIAAFNERLALELKKNYEVEIITFSLQYPSFLFPGKTQYVDEEQTYSFKIKRSINSINPLNWIKVGLMLKWSKYDVVIVRYWLPFMAPALGTIMRIAKSKTNKTLAIVDNMIPHEKRIGDKILSKYFVKSVDRFLTMTDSVSRDISKFDQKKPKIISPHPLYDHFGKPESKEEALRNLNLDNSYKYILFFGLIREYKGLDILLEAFNKIESENLRIKLLIAGEFYNNEDKYQKLIKGSLNKNNIILHNFFIPDRQVPHYFNAASVIVQPYKSATQSGVTQIAYHFNKPMIVTNVGGLPEMCPNEKVGYVVEANPKELKDAILRFFSGNENRFIEGILEMKTKFDWGSLVTNIFKVLDQSKNG